MGGVSLLLLLLLLLLVLLVLLPSASAPPPPTQSTLSSKRQRWQRHAASSAEDGLALLPFTECRARTRRPDVRETESPLLLNAEDVAAGGAARAQLRESSAAQRLWQVTMHVAHSSTPLGMAAAAALSSESEIAMGPVT